MVKFQLNVEKAQEKQQEAYRRRTKKGTKRFKVLPGMEVLEEGREKAWEALTHNGSRLANKVPVNRPNSSQNERVVRLPL